MEVVIVVAIFAGIALIVLVSAKKGKGHRRDSSYDGDSSDSWDSDGGSDSGCGSDCGGGD
ncbi:hypothetical protein [Sphingosinicella sp. YJ22]|uniref:hypothetical protein n=1 Tax=Sphingosinicella sp. YJ22 TaxID=1104780 RepID=UPI001407F0C3|nr:hypothetical protein [Sphingosinicella sp. YJ22]